MFVLPPPSNMNNCCIPLGNDKAFIPTFQAAPRKRSQVTHVSEHDCDLTLKKRKMWNQVEL